MTSGIISEIRFLFARPILAGLETLGKQACVALPSPLPRWVYDRLLMV